MTYGALVVQLIQDYEDYTEVNKHLEKMGYNIGARLIEEFLAKSSLGRCGDFKDVGEVISKVCRRVSHDFVVANFSGTGWIQIVPEHYTKHHSCSTTTANIADNEIDTCRCKSRFNVLADVRR